MEQKLEIHLPVGEEIEPKQLISLGAQGWGLVGAQRYQGLPRDEGGELTDGTRFDFEKREMPDPLAGFDLEKSLQLIKKFIQPIK